MRTAARVLIVVLCTLLCACFPRRPEVSPPPVTHPPESIIAALNGHPNRFPTFRSLIKASLTFPDGGKQKTQSFDAAFLYRKEEQEFRLQAMDILGRTHFDLAYRPHDLVIYLPPSSVTYSGDPADLPGAHGAGVFYLLKKTMEGLPPNLTTEMVSFSELADQPVIREDIETYSLVEVNPETMLIKKRTLVKRCQIIGEIRYQDYRSYGSDFLPARIEVVLPVQKVSFRFTFDSFTPEASLLDTAFQVMPPATASWFPLRDLQMDFLF